MAVVGAAAVCTGVGVRVGAGARAGKAPRAGAAKKKVLREKIAPYLSRLKDVDVPVARGDAVVKGFCEGAGGGKRVLRGTR